MTGIPWNESEIGHGISNVVNLSAHGILGESLTQLVAQASYLFYTIVTVAVSIRIRLLLCHREACMDNLAYRSFNGVLLMRPVVNRVVYILTAILMSSSFSQPASSAEDRSTPSQFSLKAQECTNDQKNKAELNKCEAELVLNNFSNDNERWRNFLKKVMSGEQGAVSLAVPLLHYASKNQKKELLSALQEALISEPKFVLTKFVKSNVSRKTLCGPSLQESYDLAAHSLEERVNVMQLLYWETNQENNDKDLLPEIDRCIKELEEAEKTFKQQK